MPRLVFQLDYFKNDMCYLQDGLESTIILYYYSPIGGCKLEIKKQGTEKNYNLFASGYITSTPSIYMYTD